MAVRRSARILFTESRRPFARALYAFWESGTGACLTRTGGSPRSWPPPPRRRPPAWAVPPAAPPPRWPPCGARPASSRTATRRASSSGARRLAARSPAAPSTTTVISPRTPSAAHSASSSSGPRRTSSYVLVSSRHTAARRSGAEDLRHGGQGRRQPVRRLEVDEGAALLGGLAQPRRAARPALRGRKPSKQNRSTGSPDSASAVSTADGPGTAVTAHARAPRPRPPAGSRGRRPTACPRPSPAAPATPPPAPRPARACGPPRCPRSRRRPGPRGRTPSACVSRRSRRVSSAATMSAAASSAREPRRRVRGVADGGSGEYERSSHAAHPRSVAGRAAGVRGRRTPRSVRSLVSRQPRRRVPYDGPVTTSDTAARRPADAERAGRAPCPPWQARLRRFGYAATAAGRRTGAAGAAVPGAGPALSAPSSGSPRAAAARLARWSAWGGPLLVALVAGVLRFWQPRLAARRDIRRDVLREGRLVAPPVRLRGQLAGQRQRPDPRRPQQHPALAGRASYVVHPPVGKWVIGARRVDVRTEPLRLALHDRRARHAVGADAVPHRAAAVPLHGAGLPGRRADGGGRAALRDEPDRAARPGADVLGAGRVRLSAASTGTGRGRSWRADWPLARPEPDLPEERRRAARAPASSPTRPDPRTGCRARARPAPVAARRRGAAWAWPAPPSGTGCTCSPPSAS